MFFIVGLVATVIGPQAAGAAVAKPDPYEEAISAWKPAAAYVEPTGSPVTDAKLLAGRWTTREVMASTQLNLERAEDGTFRVRFASSGCLGGTTAVRTATFSQGIVSLNRGVSPYAGGIFDRLFFRRRNGQLWLIPAGAVEQANDFAGDQPSQKEHWVEFVSLQKRDR